MVGLGVGKVLQRSARNLLEEGQNIARYQTSLAKEKRID